jgi:hypothetical protein
MAAILCAHRAQVSPASLCSSVSLCAFCTHGAQVSLGSFLPSLAMQEIADSPPTQTGGYRIYQTRPNKTDLRKVLMIRKSIYDEIAHL